MEGSGGRHPGEGKREIADAHWGTKETRAGETRVAVTPERVKKYIAQGHQVTVQAGAGMRASQPDGAYEAVVGRIGAVAGAL